MKKLNLNGQSNLTSLGLPAISLILLMGFSSNGTADAPEDGTVLLSDDFSASLSANWITGTNTTQNTGGPTVSIENGTVVFSQRYDYIQTKDSFTGDFEISFDVHREAGSNSCADYFIELVDAEMTAGIMRFRYGTYAKESINIGTPPSLSGSGDWDCVTDPNYLQELAHNGVAEGRIAFIHQGGHVCISFENDEGESISTSWVPVPGFESTAIRIWGLGGNGSQRYVDNVVVTVFDNGTLVTSQDSPVAGDGTLTVSEAMIALVETVITPGGSNADPIEANDPDDSTVVEPANIGGLQPLSVGNTWTYAYGTGNILTDTFTYTVTEMVNVYGTDVYKLDSDFFIGPDGEYFQLLLNHDDGVYFYGHTMHDLLQTPVPWFLTNPSIGDQWTSRGQGGEVTFECISLGNSITVPAGTFEDCIEIRTLDGSITHWYTYGIGEVKASVDTMGLVWELQSYSFN